MDLKKVNKYMFTKKIIDNIKKPSRGKLLTGFTLIELMVTLTIFAITTGIVMFSQGKFDNSVLLTNLAYDVAITIRQAQTYGVNVREFGVIAGSGKFVGYGVYFSFGTDGSDKQFNLFADANGNYKFDGDFVCNAGDIECVDKYIVKRGDKISAICAGADLSSLDCDISPLNITFKRPNPDAVILVNDDSYSTANRKNYAKIVISSADGSATRSVIVNRTGQIYVQQ